MTDSPIYYEWSDANPLNFPLPGPSRLVVVHQTWHDSTQESLCLVRSDKPSNYAPTDLLEIALTVNPHLPANFPILVISHRKHSPDDNDTASVFLAFSDNSDITKDRCLTIAETYNKTLSNLHTQPTQETQEN